MATRNIAQREARRNRAPTLDSRIREAVEHFVKVLARCGAAPDEIRDEIARACRGIPKSWAVRGRREVEEAAHVLTLWFSNPLYLDAHGNPTPIPLRGAARSVESLVHELDSKVDAQKVVRYLLRHGSLRRVGKRYVPQNRMIFLRGAKGPDNFQRLRSLLGMLRSLEHNRKSKKRAEGWFEAFAENPRFPISARAGFDSRLRQRANKMLQQLDTEMHRRERTRKRKEPTVRIGVGIYRFEETGPSRMNPVTRRRS
jgi:hypothetical protein